MMEDISAVVKLIYRKDKVKFFGPGIAELLGLVGECGSVKEACAKMGLSYSKGRMIIRRAEDMLGFPLVKIRRGGRGGGAAEAHGSAGRPGAHGEVARPAVQLV